MYVYITYFNRYQSAKKDNDFVYHDKVPDLAGLPEVKGTYNIIYCKSGYRY
jgi:hypothetical protein